MESYQWESEADKEGFGNLIQHFRQHGLAECGIHMHLMAAYFIQKNREASEYFVELIGSQVSSLQDEIRKLQMDLKFSTQLAEQLAETVKAQNLLLESLSKGNNQTKP